MTVAPPPALSFLQQPKRISYAFMAIGLVLVGWLHLTVLLLTGLFGYFALEKLTFGGRKAVAVLLFALLLGAAGYGFFAFARTATVAVPRIAEESIPRILAFADSRGIELPEGYDYEALKSDAVDFVRGKLASVGKYAGEVLRAIVAFLIGVVVSVSLFLNTRVEPDADPVTGRNNLYSQTFLQVVERFRTFYQSFKTVMGAQIIISLINALLTSLFLFWNGFPYAPVLAGLTFLLGLLPIVGNLLSNTLIVSVGFTLSPRMALLSLIFLVVIHKGEYFLNSKIIGDRIKNPMWLTLVGLLIGEKLMGIPGMILAPAVLHYVKVEASRNRIAATESTA
ncbi:MAG: AI-2E family transporter [Gemmatimonadales bacterium]|nr:AI-2E family transporter [Gemmatimonadales bacterium]